MIEVGCNGAGEDDTSGSSNPFKKAEKVKTQIDSLQRQPTVADRYKNREKEEPLFFRTYH